MGKRGAALLAFLLAMAMSMGLAACGDSGSSDAGSSVAADQLSASASASADTASSAASAPTSGGMATMPSSNIDPADIDAGMVRDAAGANGTSDIWYKDGAEGAEGIFLTNASNDAGLDVAWIDANGNETASQFDMVVENRHLKSADGAEPTVDLVFNDNMTCFDYASSTWYIRGDQAAIEALVAGKTFAADDRVLTFNEDGTVSETLRGSEYGGVWEVVSPTVVSYWYPDDDLPLNFQLMQDGGAVLLYLGSQEFTQQ